MAEVAAGVGLAASIVSLVEVSAKVISRLHEFISKAGDVPESLRSLSTRLPLLTATLEHIRHQAEASHFPANVTKALEEVVKDTCREVSSVDICLSKVLPSDNASRLERGLKALKSLAKEEKVNQALEKIHKNTDILILHQTTRHVDTGDRILQALSKLSVTPSTTQSPLWTIPFGRDPDFVDRGSLVDQLLDKSALPASRTALVGLGGVGKSQLAIELAYRIKERSPETWVFWIYASSAARIEQGFRDVADHLEIPGRQDPRANVFELVHNWLRGGRCGRWFLIIDNIDDPSLLSQPGVADQGRRENSENREVTPPMKTYIPQSQHGSILVTSRSQAAASHLMEARDIVPVQPMAREQALLLFEKKLGTSGQGNDIAELAAALEYMPLAIAQAAAYISQRAPRCSAGKYVQDLRKSDKKKTSLLNYGGGELRRDWQANNSVLITWQISFEHIQRSRPSAAGLLSLMSFFDRQGIPEDLLQNRTGAEGVSEGSTQSDAGNEEGDSDTNTDDNSNTDEECDSDTDDESGSEADEGFEDDVQTLRDYSFISVGTNRTFEIHALVQLATRKWLDANGQLEVWKQRSIENLSGAFPTGDYENWTSCQVLFPHAMLAATHQPRGEASLRQLALLLHNAAWYAYENGSRADSVELSEKAMMVSKKAYGPEHAETLTSMNILADRYRDQERLEEAEALGNQLMETSIRVLGQDHPDTLRSIGNLAYIYKNQGRYEEAEALGNQLVETSTRVFGEEHPDTLWSIANLAVTYTDQGRFEEAETLEYRLVETTKRTQGEEHPDTMTRIAYLAGTYYRLGRFEEAEALRNQLMETRKRVLGQEHPETIISMHELADSWESLGRAAEAISLMEKVIQMRKQILDPRHPHTELSLEMLGQWKTKYECPEDDGSTEHESSEDEGSE